MFFNSSWAIFSPLQADQNKNLDKDEEEKVPAKAVKASKPEKAYTPFMFYGKTFSFENTEKKIINDLRAWSSQIFTKHFMLSD